MREIILVTGACASGKSCRTKEIVERTKKKNTIILDINNETLYQAFQVIKPNKVAQFLTGNKGKVARILPSTRNKKMTTDQIEKMVSKLISTCNNGILVLESISSYATPKLLEKIRASYANKKDNLSIVCIFQSINSIPSRLLYEADEIRLHKQMQEINGWRDTLDKFEIFKIASLIVENKTKSDPYFYLFINRWTTIEGNFSKDDYRNACVDYIIIQKGFHRYSEHF